MILSVRFRRPVPSDRTVKVRGAVESEKGRILYTAGEITLDGEVLAEATAKMVRIG